MRSARPVSVTPPTSRADRTRAALIAAAHAAFAADGFDGATGARIAADAGVSEPTIANRFGSKSGLLAAVIGDYYDDLLEAMEEVLDMPGGPQARLRAFAQWWLRTNDRHYPLLRVFSERGRRPDPDDDVVLAFRAGNRRVTRAFDRMIGELAHLGALREDLPPRIIRDAFFGATEHTMVARVLTGRPEDLDAAAEALVSLLLDGARPRAAAEQTGLSEISGKLDRILERLA